jgi:hypothetical protein
MVLSVSVNLPENYDNYAAASIITHVGYFPSREQWYALKLELPGLYDKMTMGKA